MCLFVFHPGSRCSENPSTDEVVSERIGFAKATSLYRVSRMTSPQPKHKFAKINPASAHVCTENKSATWV
jgi:hypothetical protein